MLLVTAPVRVDVVGGLTDIPLFAGSAGTDVTNIAVDLYSDERYETRLGIEVRGLRTGSGAVRFRLNGQEQRLDGDDKDGLYLLKSIIRDTSAGMPEYVGWEIDVTNTLPRRTGLGASGTLSLCLLACCEELRRGTVERWPDGDVRGAVSVDLIRRAYQAEVVDAGITGGCQDFVAAYFGNVNHVTFASLGDVNLAGQPEQLGVSVEPELAEYLDANMIVAVRRSGNVGSDALLATVIEEFQTSRARLGGYLDVIRGANAEAFPLLTQKGGNLPGRLSRLGQLMDESWAAQKSLNPRLPADVLDRIEARVRPLVIGVRGPGQGINSLFLLAEPATRADVLAVLREYDAEIDIAFARVNTAGLVLRG